MLSSRLLPLLALVLFVAMESVPSNERAVVVGDLAEERDNSHADVLAVRQAVA